MDPRPSAGHADPQTVVCIDGLGVAQQRAVEDVEDAVYVWTQRSGDCGPARDHRADCKKSSPAGEPRQNNRHDQ